MKRVIETLLILSFAVPTFLLAAFDVAVVVGASSSLVGVQSDLNVDAVVNIVVGFTAGVLGLVGLVAVFASMNSQHKVQKARELLWALGAVPYSYLESNTSNIGAQVFRDFQLYEQLANGKDEFIGGVVNLARLTLLAVPLLWAACIVYLWASASAAARTVVFITWATTTLALIGFRNILGKLATIAVVGSLPNPETLLDVDNLHSDVDMLSVIGVSMQLRAYIENNANPVHVEVGLPVPVYNLQIMPKVAGTTAAMTGWELFYDTDEAFFVQEGGGYYRFGAGPAKTWHKLFDFKLKGNYDELHIQLTVSSRNGAMYVNYRGIDVAALRAREWGGMTFSVSDVVPLVS